MDNQSVTILDYGMCNLLNVARAFQHIGAEVKVTDNPNVAISADRLVVPGVGAFRDSMNEISSRGFGEAIVRFAQSERPLFGICVGMQILFEGSDEFGDYPGLGILQGRVRAIPKENQMGVSHRVPHIGWNNLLSPLTERAWVGSILEPLNTLQTAMYFVHSFSAHPADESDTLADCFYGGHRLCASVEKGSVMATQFHPERSGEAGLAVLRRFIEL